MKEQLQEENTYFRNIIKDAVSDLKKNNVAYVFYEEQVNEILKYFDKDSIKVILDDDIFCLTKK